MAATYASVTAAADTLELRLDAPAEIPAGGTVELRVVARNVAGRALDLYLRGRAIAFDVSAETAAGSVVWSRLHDGIVPAILRLETLAPGDSLVLTHEWDQRANTGAPVPPGEYILRGLLLTEGEPLRTAPRTLRITAPR